jgi:hypothetical protein
MEDLAASGGPTAASGGPTVRTSCVMTAVTRLETRTDNTDQSSGGVKHQSWHFDLGDTL